MKNSIFEYRIAAYFIAATGYGWAGGHFIPSEAPIYAYLFQFIILTLLIILLFAFLRSNTIGNRSSKVINISTIIFAISLLLNAGNVIRGYNNKTVYGSHNSLADLVPIVLIMSGSLLWLAMAFPKKPDKNAFT